MFPPLSQQEILETVNFFRDHAPNRFALFDQLDDGFPRRRVLRVMNNRFRQIQRFRESDPDLYAMSVKQFELQDEAFGILRSAGNSASGGGDPEAVARLREKVRTMVEVGLKEREKRVDRLERMLRDEKARLEADKADPDGLIARQMKQLRNESEEVKRYFDQIQEFQRGRDDRANPTPTTAPAPSAVAPGPTPAESR